MTRAIIFDLDGTLTESKSPLTADMGTLLARLMNKMPVAIMSGGSYAQFQKQLLGGVPEDANYENLYLFPTSAAQCYTWKDGGWQILYNNPFTPEEKFRVLAALAESLKETGFGEPPTQLWGEQTEDRDAQITWSALGQQAPIESKSAWDPDHKKREQIISSMAPRVPGFLVRIGGTTSIDITKRGIDKSYGVKRLSEIISIPIPDMLYVGDALFPGGNDEIVKESGIETEQVTSPAETGEVIERLLTDA